MWKIVCNSSFIFIKFFNHNLVVLKRAHVTSKENSNFNVSWDALFYKIYLSNSSLFIWAMGIGHTIMADLSLHNL